MSITDLVRCIKPVKNYILQKKINDLYQQREQEFYNKGLYNYLEVVKSKYEVRK